jgi:hypothetical protein
MVYTSICAISNNNCITIGVIYTPPRNPLILKALQYCVDTSTKYNINYYERYFIKNSNNIYYYHIYTSYFMKIIKENSIKKLKIVKNGLVEMKNMPNIYLFKEKCTNNKKDCYDGLDIKKLCCYIYDKNERIIKVRYADYPWN